MYIFSRVSHGWYIWESGETGCVASNSHSHHLIVLPILALIALLILTWASLDHLIFREKIFNMALEGNEAAGIIMTKTMTSSAAR